MSDIKGRSTARNHSHYYKNVASLDEIHVYMTCELFGIQDNSGALQHAIKKLLCSGSRGAKGSLQDVREASDTLNRYIEMNGGDFNDN